MCCVWKFGLWLLLIPDDALFAPLPRVRLPVLGVIAGVELAGAAAGATSAWDNGAKIILKTSSSDMSAASIAAQSPSLLPVPAAALRESAVPKFETTCMRDCSTLCWRTAPLLLRLTTTFSQSWLTCCLTVLAGWLMYKSSTCARIKNNAP